MKIINFDELLELETIDSHKEFMYVSGNNNMMKY